MWVTLTAVIIKERVMTWWDLVDSSESFVSKNLGNFHFFMISHLKL